MIQEGQAHLTFMHPQVCKQCGTSNAPAKKTCERCGAFLEGRTINNVTGKIGYRHADGSFTPDKPLEGIRVILSKAREYVNRFYDIAAGRFENPEGEYYDDVGQYWEMREAKALLDKIDHLNKEDPLSKIQAVVDAQAEDDGLWFIAQTAAEAYLQQELRRLHSEIEAQVKNLNPKEDTP